MRSGESIKEILWYWLPEVISVALLVYAPLLIDSILVASLNSTTTYGALGVASNFLHTLTKLAEALPVAAQAIIGRHNGAKEYKKCGRDLGDAFWTTCIIGLSIFSLVFFGAGFIYSWMNVPDNMLRAGVPFLRLRSFGVFLIFIFMAFIGFIKGIKNTHVPMMINIVGVSTFVFFDYALILGRWGFPQMQLTGSAYATIIQYSLMNLLAVSYILFNPAYKKYFEKAFFLLFNPTDAVRLLNLSWPIMVDKTSLGIAYIWLAKLIAPMGKYVIVTYDTIKQLERIAFLPALGFASIITFLVSNRIGAGDLVGARKNVKKVLLLSVAMVSCSITLICLNSRYLLSFFDSRGKWTDFAAPLLPVISTLVIFDLVQVVLAASLRGAGDVRTVMLGRFFTVFCFFIPLVTLISWLPIENMSVRFALLYGSFYISNGVMGFIFTYRIVGNAWQKKRIV